MTARQSRHPPARSWSPGSARAGANGASSTRSWKPTRSASSPISPGRDARSPRGRNAWPGCAGRRSSSASPVTRPSTRAPSPLSRYSHWRATCIERCPRGSDRGSAEKGLPRGRHLAAGLPVLLRSWSNTLVSVQQVTQRNTGRKTAGIDGEVALTPEARAQMAVRVHQSIMSWNPRAVKRVHIPKASNRAKLRPLGIPVIMDRCHQQRVRHALEPEWEARFEPKSYGFRPGRSCQDAIAAIFITCAGPRAKRVWALDADLAAAFDKIGHSFLLSQLGSFPARDMIRDWLTAGVFEAGKGFAPTEEGTPQGGPISPCLLNVALHGLEEAAGVRYRTSGTRAGDTMSWSPAAIRYADDVVVLCHSQEQAGQVK